MERRLHLEPRNITLPDGTHYVVHAQLIDTSRDDFNVDYEGTLKSAGPSEEDAGGDVVDDGECVLVAGAMIGGGVGAVVGAGSALASARLCG